MKILFTICGRAGSKGIKNKNIKKFLNQPLPYYTLSVIDLFLKRNPEYDADIVLNTDSIELIDLFKKNNMRSTEVVERDAALSGDTVPKVAVILECLEKREACGIKYDMVVDLDITSPLRKEKDLEALIHKKLETDCDIVFSVTEARRNPYFNMVKKEQKGYSKVLKSDFAARQQAPEVFDMNASMYAYSPEYLRRAKSIFDGYCEVIQMDDTGILDLDHENDLELMQVIAQYLFQSKIEFGEIKENIR